MFEKIIGFWRLKRTADGMLAEHSAAEVKELEGVELLDKVQLAVYSYAALQDSEKGVGLLRNEYEKIKKLNEIELQWILRQIEQDRYYDVPGGAGKIRVDLDNRSISWQGRDYEVFMDKDFNFVFANK